MSHGVATSEATWRSQRAASILSVDAKSISYIKLGNRCIIEERAVRAPDDESLAWPAPLITEVSSSTKLVPPKSIGRSVSNYITERRTNHDKDHSVAQESARDGNLRAGGCGDRARAGKGRRIGRAELNEPGDHP